jgi:uncharacterized protein YkwD
MARRLGTSIVSLLALAAVAACSDSPVAPELSPSTEVSLAKGGKKGGNTPTSPAPDTTTTTAPIAPTAPSTGTTVTGCDGSAVTLTAEEKATLDLHQQTRAQYGLPLYCVHPALVASARAHSADMLAHNFFSHSSWDGTAWNTRIGSFGYPGWTISENIAWGSSGSYGDPATIMNNWMNSAGHRATILNGAYVEIGIGVSIGYYQGFSGSRVYTADFGSR